MTLIVAADQLRRHLLRTNHDRQWLSTSVSIVSEIKTLWCGQVVFGNGQSDDDKQQKQEPQLVPGSIDIVGDTIVACHPGEPLEQAKSRRQRTPRKSTSKDFLNLGSDFVLSPGLIDVHTHISALGRSWEGYETSTKAATAGGITTIIGMPLNSIPATTTLEAVDMELQAAKEATLYSDVGLWGGVVPGNMADSGDALERLLASPHILGLKAFLAPLPPAAGYESVSPQQLLTAARICSKYKKPILVHSELMTENECEKATEHAFAEGSVQSYSAHLQSRPEKWEQDAVKVVCEAATVCSMHIVHLSDGRGCLPLIQDCKNQTSMSLTVETCPHYLLLDRDQISDGDTRVKCFPPIRDAANREVLWKGLDGGWIDMIASDHSPCEPGMRLMGKGDFKNAWGGLSGLQYQLQATWTEASKRGKTPIDMARWWSLNPAKLIGVSNKGSISVGQQADLCWWDPNYEGAPNEYSQEHHRWTGTTYFASNPAMRGRVLGTWVRGEMVYDGREDEHKAMKGSVLKCRET